MRVVINSAWQVWFAGDCSGSVGGSKVYFSEIARVVQTSPPATSYFLWDDRVTQKSEGEIKQWILKKTGYHGTKPSKLAAFIVANSFHGTLRFVTDGLVEENEVEECDRILHGETLRGGRTGYVFEKVEVCIIETVHHLDRSVVLPFIRFSPFEVKCVPLYESQPPVETIYRADLELFETFLQQQKDIDFEEKAQRLKEVAQARFMGTSGSSRVRDAAILAKKRLTKEMSEQLGADVGRRLLQLLESPVDHSMEACMVAKRMVANFLSVKGESPAIKALDSIIGLCEGVAKKCFSKADAERAISTPLQRAETVPEPLEKLPMAQVPEDDETCSWFQCPVTLDDSLANLVLLLACADGKKGRCFIDTLDDDFKKLVGTNPLWLWLREDCVDKFASMIDETISCGGLRQAREAGFPVVVSPTTRRPLASAFPLSTATEAHCKARRWALMKAVAGGKRWGNPELWFVNLALVIHRKKVNERLQQALPIIIDCLKKQLASSRTYASLSGLPELPMTVVPVSTAFWLVASGPMYYPKMTLQLLPLMNEIRWVVEQMGYILPEGTSIALDRLQIVQTMRSWKLGKQPHGAVSTEFNAKGRLDNLMTALSQRCMRISDSDARTAKKHLPMHFEIVEFVELDGEADETQIDLILSLLPVSFREHSLRSGWRDLVALAKIADPDKKPAECVPPLDISSIEERPAIEWAYGLKAYDRCDVSICPDTARPFCSLVTKDAQEISWKQEAEAVYGFVHESNTMISVHEGYGKFVEEFGFYPLEPELALYLRQKWIVSGKKNTLPYLLQQFISEILESVHPVASEITAAEFGVRFKQSCPCKVRLLVEKTYLDRL